MYKNNYYKGKYFIAFYDKDGEEFVNCFDSVINILYFLKRPITAEEVNKMNVRITKALKYDKCVFFLDGEPRKIFLIEI